MLGGILAAAMVGALPVFLVRVLNDAAGTDFPEFYEAGRHVLEHQTRQPNSILYYYLPSLDVAWMLVAWMPLKVAAVAYYAFGCVCWVGILCSVRRYLLPATPRDDQTVVLLCAGLLTAVSAVDNLLAGAFHLLMVWLMVAGLGRIIHGRRGGPALLGMAIWLKLLPGIAIVYLLLKRRWTAAAGSVAMAVTLDVGLSVGGYGATQARALHAQWWKAQAVGQLTAILERPTASSAQSSRNQSSPAVARRLLNHRPIFVSDRGHIYDQMIDRGASLRKTVAICYGLAGLYALVGLAMSQIRTRYAAVVYLLVVIVSAAIVWRKGYLRMEGLRGSSKCEG